MCQASGDETRWWENPLWLYLDPFIGSNGFLVASLGLPVCGVVSSTKSDRFTSSFPAWMSSLLFIAWLWWLRLPALCWIKVARGGLVVLFLIWEEALSALHQSLLGLLAKIKCSSAPVGTAAVAGRIWPLLCSGTFPLCPLCWEFLS